MELAAGEVKCGAGGAFCDEGTDGQSVVLDAGVGGVGLALKWNAAVGDEHVTVVSFGGLGCGFRGHGRGGLDASGSSSCGALDVRANAKTHRRV